MLDVGLTQNKIIFFVTEKKVSQFEGKADSAFNSFWTTLALCGAEKVDL